MIVVDQYKEKFMDHARSASAVRPSGRYNSGDNRIDSGVDAVIGQMNIKGEKK